MFKIEKNVPFAERKYPFAKMEVGDSFEVPVTMWNSAKTSATHFGIRHNRKFAARLTGPDTGRIWRIA
jgi:hypothetical protein